ncbi:hypothetical protein GCM10023189_49020 [Nibrella saemangeumensis]|uniref:Uncharacterized protein n=2 Tax=Nibrella saemangeumensis TaxID=1084526 RepID=A0ABP8NFT9_9BACT
MLIFGAPIMQYTPEDILNRIAQLQSKGGNRGSERYFPWGLLPSYRVNPYWLYRRPDTNVFFTAITIFTLRQLHSRVSTEAQRLIDDIAARGVSTYELFRNKDGLKTYNFYQTHPSRHFPHGLVMRHFEHFRIPDDIDDTAMVYLTSPPTPEELLWLKEKLVEHANGSKLTIRNTFRQYRSLRAYSTWFGKNMPIEFDACALCNMLYCIYQYKLPLKQHDTDSLAFLRSIVATNRYRTHPFRCAHNYARTSLIIYHLSRLIAGFEPPELQSVREKLIRDTELELNKVRNRLDKILLATSLLRLGQRPPAVSLENIERDFAGFHFFVAGMLSAYENPLVYFSAGLPFWHIRWQCEAHNWALVLEYVVLRQERTHGL